MQKYIESINLSLSTGNNYAALALALSAPDVCGWILDPSQGSKNRYIEWFDKYIKQKYTLSASSYCPERVFLSGSDCYALRCAYLHEGRENITDQRAREVLDAFQFTVPPSGWVVHNNKMNNTLQLQVDIFCRDIIEGIEAFLVDAAAHPDCINRLNQGLLIRDVNGNPL